MHDYELEVSVQGLPSEFMCLQFDDEKNVEGFFSYFVDLYSWQE